MHLAPVFIGCVVSSLVVAMTAAAFAADDGRATTRPSELAAADIRGISWSDPRDNYNPAQIVPAGLAIGDTKEKAAAVANAVADRVLSIDANVVRLGINPPTVADEAWWGVYRAAIQTLARRNIGVILCAWEQSPTVAGHGRGDHNGRFGGGDLASYSAMWKSVHEAFRDEPNVIAYELLNEPFGYRNQVHDYVRDMRALMTAIGTDLRGKHILIAGIGYSDDIQSLRKSFPVATDPHVWFAYHVYPNWFGGEAKQTRLSRERYATEIAAKLKGVESRTVITEFGCWGGEGYDYSRPADAQRDLDAQRHVAYLQGVADACERLHLGSIYWYADARHKGDRRTYDLFNTSGEGVDADRQNQLRRAWRLR